jgi:hypothetical protein
LKFRKGSFFGLIAKKGTRNISNKARKNGNRGNNYFRGGLFFCYLFWYSEKKYYSCMLEKVRPEKCVFGIKVHPEKCVLVIKVRPEKGF